MRSVRVHAEEEDKLLDNALVGLIEGIHGLEVIRVYRHVAVGGYEVDAVLVAETRQRRLRRSVGLELKIRDWAKAMKQAILRRPHFHLFYVVMGDGLGNHAWGLRAACPDLCHALAMGVGLIYRPIIALKAENKMWLLAKSTHNPHGIKPTTLEDYWVEQDEGGRT